MTFIVLKTVVIFHVHKTVTLLCWHTAFKRNWIRSTSEFPARWYNDTKLISAWVEMEAWK